MRPAVVARDTRLNPASAAPINPTSDLVGFATDRDKKVRFFQHLSAIDLTPRPRP
jgi:hypothetical protein